MWAELLDRAAVVYNVEFVRAYATGAPWLLHQVSTQFAEDNDLSALLPIILKAAIQIAPADMGNVQLFDREKRTFARCSALAQILSFASASPPLTSPSQDHFGMGIRSGTSSAESG